MADLSFLRQFTGGNTVKMKRYIQIYLQVALQVFDNMEGNIKDEDWNQLRINAHSIKPQAEYMGILPLKAILEEIENNVKNNDLKELSSLFLKAKKLHVDSIPSLEQFLSST